MVFELKPFFGPVFNLNRSLFCLHFPGSEYGKNQPKAQDGSKGITKQAQQGGDGNGVDTEKIDRKFHHLLRRI
jgi:hypothetical protein